MRASNLLNGAGAAVLASVFCVAAMAQNAPPASPETTAYPSCPERPVSVYFSSGNMSASPETLTVLGRIGEAAQSCRPDHVDLVAYVNPGIEGDGALSLSLGRLDTIAKELAATGVPMPALRTATKHVAEAGAGTLIQIDIVMRRSDQATPAEDDIAPSRPRAAIGSHAV